MKILEVQHVEKIYGVHENKVRALTDITFSAEQGEFAAIVGTSGSGKSTLLNLIGGLDLPTKGKILVQDRDIAGLKRKELTIFRRRNIRFVFQNYSLMPVLNVYDNVALPVTFDRGHYMDHSYIVHSGVLLLFLLFFISWVLVCGMERFTLRELLGKEDGNRHKSRRIYSTAGRSLTGILTKKFMFARKGAFVGILISLSVGGVIFLGVAYVTENTKIHNELTFKADDGLGSDIQVYEDSDVLSDVMPKNTAVQLEGIPGIAAVSPVRYMLGEILLENGAFRWPTYYAEVADEEGFAPDPEQMRDQNTVIFKTLLDGQGDYDGIDIHPGDPIFLKSPVSAEVPKEALRFQGDESQYREKEFSVTALASRPLGKVDTYIGDEHSGTVDIIMTNEQMKENFGVEGYQTISINLKEGADASGTADKIRKVTSQIDKCVVKDYTRQIRTQNLYLAQKMLFFYGVALILLVISLLHIMNSMQYLVAARKHEFGILRAMGITDTGFRKMLAKEGVRYGIYSSLVMAAAYLIVQKVLYYFMVHVYRYLHPKTELSVFFILAVAAVNICICVAAVLASGQAVLKEQVIDEIR